jgi:enoyl-CoA hydratase/carnithine racemase
LSEDVVVTWREPERAVATITLARAETSNSLTPTAADEVRRALDSVSNAVCVVLQSTGSVFCSGADLGRLRTSNASPQHAVEEMVRENFQRLIKTVRAHPAVIVGRIQGPAVGAGADLALACDIKIAASGAWFQETWMRLGLIPALGGGFALPRLAGAGWALEMMLTGRRVDAEEALSVGIFQRVVAREDLDAEVEALVATIAAHDGDAVRALKRVATASETESLGEWLDGCAGLQAERVTSPSLIPRLDRIERSIAEGRSAGASGARSG